MNAKYRDNDWPLDLYRRLIKFGLVRGLQVAPPSAVDEAALTMPHWATRRLRQLNRERVDAIERLDVDVIGDTARLLLPDQHGVRSEQTTAADLVSTDVLVEGVAAMMAAVIKERDLTGGAARQPKHMTSKELMAELVRRVPRSLPGSARRRQRSADEHEDGSVHGL